MNLKLRIWKQNGCKSEGHLENYDLSGVSPDMSFLEMLDYLNEKLAAEGKETVHFESDCREGICGTCGVVIDGVPHGNPGNKKATCELRMRVYREGDVITVEPFRAAGFPVLKDLAVDRSSFDRIIASGGFVSVNAGNAVDGNAIPIGKTRAEMAFDAATCIGCGACVAACKNASAMLFVAAKVSHLALLPQGEPERRTRVKAMVAQMDAENFGSCTNEGECSAVCPKGISFENIVRLNREYLRSNLSPSDIE